MSWTYQPLTMRPLDQVRLLLGDTTFPTPPAPPGLPPTSLQDEEITLFLTMTAQGSAPPPPAIYRAASMAASALAARYAPVVTYSVPEHISLQAQQKFEHYSALAASLLALVNSFALVPYAGGISRADKQIQVQDSDRVQPYFLRDQDSEPGTEPDNSQIVLDPQESFPI